MRGGFARTLSDPAERDAVHSSCFRVGGVSVEIVGESSTDVSLVSSLEPFRVIEKASDINIQIEWVATLPASSGCQLFDSGSVWQLYERNHAFQFDFQTPILGKGSYKRLLVDDQFCRASLLISDECFENRAAAAPLEYPLDELLIMHRLTQERAIELHGVGVVGPDGASNLFIGHSGAGKSTTARLWTSLHDVKILSDDRIIIREDTGRENTGRENKDSEDASEIFMYGTPWHGEAHFALPDRAPLQRIFVLEHGRGNMLTRLTRSQVVAELFARAFVPFHRHEYVDSALSFLERVADTVPCYRYSFEPNERAVERILTFRD
jgi:hypothetical protein